MQDEGKTRGRPHRLQKGKEIVRGIGRAKARLRSRGSEFARAAVQDDRLPGSGGDCHLSSEGRLLHVNDWIVEMVVVQANLAHRNAQRIGHNTGERSEGLRRGLLSLLRMNAGRGPKAQLRLGMLAGQCQRAMHRRRSITDADRENARETSGARRKKDGPWIVVEVEVCVAVDQARAPLVLIAQNIQSM